jgi:hypothetical protein
LSIAVTNRLTNPRTVSTGGLFTSQRAMQPINVRVTRGLHLRTWRHLVALGWAPSNLIGSSSSMVSTALDRYKEVMTNHVANTVRGM